MELNNNQISDVNLPAPTVTMVKGKGIKIDVNGTSFNVMSDWIYERRVQPKISYKGSVLTSVRELNVSLYAEITEAEGKSAVGLVSCDASIGEFDAAFGNDSPLNRIVRLVYF